LLIWISGKVGFFVLEPHDLQKYFVFLPYIFLAVNGITIIYFRFISEMLAINDEGIQKLL